jgi:hypothetical protein
MQKLLSKFKNSYIRLFILLISSLCLGFMLTYMPKETPFWIIQAVGGIYFLEAISYIMDIHLKIQKYKLQILLDEETRWDKNKPKKLQTEHLVYMSDDMYLPIHYKGYKVEQPYYSGDGNLSVNELQKLCNQFTEYTHQQAVIKQNCMKHIFELKFGVEFPQNEA